MQKVKRKVLAGAAVAVVGVLALAALGAGGILGWEYSNSDAFCTNTCHAVHPEEPVAHAGSPHARVQCVECHMGRVPTLSAMVLKSEHIHELWGMVVGYERPLLATTLKPARLACEACHWPATTHDDTVRVKKHYAPDERSTEIVTRLVVHTGFEIVREGDSKGVHWHVETPVEYVALDPQRQDIPWVRVTYRDGRIETYIDQSRGDPSTYADAERRTMDCIDCHNAVGHPFPNPEDRIDSLLARGRIDRRLPGVKARALALGQAAAALDERGEATPEAVRGLVGEAVTEYRKTLGAAAPSASLGQFEREMVALLEESQFAAEGVTWRTFPNNVGHKDFPGCFRCHDGKHLNAEGKAIRLQCNLCHSLPEVHREGGPAPVASTVIPGVTQPPSHLEPNFMHDHRFRLDASCGGCHGEPQFGREGGSFCANPACHGRKWPEVNLNVTLR
jgi:hypothetical protein